MALRPYQVEALSNVTTAMNEGINKQLIVVPTGGGKTEIFAKIPEAIAMKSGEAMFCIVQRDELCWQAMDKLQRRNPDLKVSLEKAQYRAELDADIVVASIQTLGMAKVNDSGDWVYSDRLLKFDPARFRAIVYDEVHHLPSKLYHGSLRHFNVFKPEFVYDDPSKLLLGVTATPNHRSDGQGLELFFDKIVFSRELREMIDQGWLANVRAFRVDTDVSLEGVSVRQGDFATKELEETVNTPARNNLIVEKYKELGAGLPALAFTVDVAHSEDLAAAFRLAGITAQAISGKTPANDRRKLIQMYAEGSLKVLTSCQVLLEGFDAPLATIALCCRPTKSKLLYCQSIGRVLRPYPAPEEDVNWTKYRKTAAIVIDFVDLSSKHRLETLASLFGMRPGFDLKGKKITETLEEVERLVAKAPGVSLDMFTDVEKLKSAVQEISLFAKPVIPDVIRQNSSLAWTTGMSEGVYQVSFDKTSLRIATNTLGQFEIFKNVQGMRTPLGTSNDLKRALSLAEMEVPAEWYTRLQADASWRFTPPSDKQLDLYAMLYKEVRRLYQSDADFAAGIRAKYTKGELSQLITAKTGDRPSRKPAWVGKGQGAGR